MRKGPDTAARVELPSRAAVVGAGLMGAALAQILALAEIETWISDVDEPTAQAGRERAITSAAAFEAHGWLEAGSVERVSAHLRAAEGLELGVDGAALVIEAVTEDIAVKQQTYARLEQAAAADTVIATNTSAIPIRELAAGFSRPERFLGAHWFNPPQWVACVEVIPGPETDREVVAWVVGVLRGLGKSPVEVGDAAGFVANRLQFAMFREAAAIVEDGVATPEQVDAVVRGSFGFRLPFFGPFLIAEMAGLDVYLGAYAALEAEFGHRLAAPPALRELVESGRLGMKTGGGFFNLPNENLPALLERRDRAYVELGRLLERLTSE